MQRLHSIAGVSGAVSLTVRASSSVAHAANVTRPPYYRKPHRHHTPKHMLQEEFPNAGDASGAGIRLFDYYKTAEIVEKLPTIKEKIDFVSPYERPWTRAEKTWRRDWHPTLIATRKAWSVPRTPAYFDCLNFYKYITKTRLIEGSLDNFYKGLVPPTANFEKTAMDSLRHLLETTHFDSEEERVEAILAALFDDAAMCLAHNIPRLSDYRAAYSVQSESFWIRAGFMFLYDKPELESDVVTRDLRNISKYTGDDRRKLGELAFVSRDQLAFQMRSKEELSPVVPLESTEVTEPVFDQNQIDVAEEVLYSPRVFNLWPDEEPLWQCPGYFVESDETHTYSRLAAKSLYSLDKRIDTWWDIRNAEERAVVWEENAKAQAVSSLFTTLNAQAHTHGFTQYTDITRPFTSQITLSNGKDFVFAVGQLNTIAINIECDGFVNNKANLCYVEKPEQLYTSYEKGTFYHEVKEEGKSRLVEGLNPKVLTRIMQMLMKN